MKLYGMGKSRSFRCLWALAEAGVECEYINLEFGKDGELGARNEKYLGINSQGKVPALVDDDFTLTESGAIINYIATISDKPDLIPSELVARAHYDELAFFVLSDLEQPLWTNGKHRFAIPEQYRVPSILETTTWEFAKAQRALTALIGENPIYALGDQFTMADILVAHTLAWAEGFKYELLPGLKAFKDRHYQRPACVAALNRIPG